VTSGESAERSLWRLLSAEQISIDGSRPLLRPRVWSRFGALEPQAADYRACAAFGPLYR